MCPGLPVCLDPLPGHVADEVPPGAVLLPTGASAEEIVRIMRRVVDLA
jgi:hypothetical protein